MSTNSLPILAISVIDILILWAMATLIFGAPFKGDPILFFLISVVYVICTASVGMLVSILVQPQVAAILVTMVPAMLYSGLMVPVGSMQESARMVASILPAHHYLNIVWDIFLKNQPLIKPIPDRSAIVAFRDGHGITSPFCFIREGFRDARLARRKKSIAVVRHSALRRVFATTPGGMHRRRKREVISCPSLIQYIHVYT